MMQMQINNPIVVATLFFSLFGCNSKQIPGQPDSVSPYFNQEWAKNTIWDDGQAEIAKYKATRIVYGKLRSYEYTYILVKEVFNKEFGVKTDDYSRADLFPVMKVNKFCSFETKAYPYHYLTSVFFERDKVDKAYKLTNTSQEWCGNTAKSFTRKDRHFLFEFMSYWDGQGNGSMKIDHTPMFEDQLSYSLRSLNFEDGLSFEAPIYPSQINSRATKPVVINSKFTVTLVSVHSGLSKNDSDTTKAWKVHVENEEESSSDYWFDRTYPNAMLKMESSDGRSLVLDSLYRDAYWAHE
ncbi:MAG: hypothetical protein ACJA0X_001112 [Cyclobacteriaceae bacterium]|jgi:hypothetical protein